MKEYRIKRVTGSFNWDEIPELAVDQILWEPDWGIRAFGRICYDEDNLYLRLRAVEENIRAEYLSPMSPVCTDSCLEFFFLPEDRYFNIEINPNGCMFVGLGHDRSDTAPLPRDDYTELLDIQTKRTEDGWEVSYRIPLSFIQLYQPGYTFTGTLKANVYKCGDLTVHKHFLSWNPVLSEKPDFHRPQDFGTMIFE